MRELYALKGARTVPGRGEDSNILSLFDSPGAMSFGKTAEGIREVPGHPVRQYEENKSIYHN